MILSSAFLRFALPLFGALGMAGVLSGCSGASNTSALPDVKPASLTSASQVRLPLDSFQPTFAQQTLVGNAVTKLADRCLSQRGFSAGPAFLGHVDNPISAVDMSAVQWLTVQAAEKYGFNQPLPAAVRQYSQTEWAAGGVFALKPAVRKAFYQGGCLSQAATQVAKGIGSAVALGGSPQQAPGYTTYYELAWPGLPMQLEEEAVNETEADPHAAAVTSAWRSCMQQEGYKYASPADALADPRWASGTVAANALSANRGLQVKVAVADARCQESVNFAGIRLALLTAYQERLIKAYTRQLHEYEAQFSTLVANARLILAGRDS
jgi:hypothetical protein